MSINKGGKRVPMEHVVKAKGKAVAADFKAMKLNLDEIKKKHSIGSGTMTAIAKKFGIDMKARGKEMIRKSYLRRQKENKRYADFLHDMRNTGEHMIDLAIKHEMSRSMASRLAADNGIDVLQRGKRIREMGQKNKPSRMNSQLDANMAGELSRKWLGIKWVERDTPRCFYYGGVA